MSLSDELQAVRNELAEAAPEFLPDYCSIISSSSVPDGFGGTTDTDSTLEEWVPCKYEALSNPMEKQGGGGDMVTLGHLLTLPATAITQVIRPHYKIVVYAQNDQPELTFRNPTTMDGSFSVFVKLAAELVE